MTTKAAGPGFHRAVALAVAVVAAGVLGPICIPSAGAAQGPTTTTVAAGNQDVFPAGMTPDGHWVLVESTATDLGGPTTGHLNAYLWNHDTRTLEALTNGNADVFPTSLSDDGRFVTVQSDATNLVPGISGLHLFQIDHQTHTTTVLAPDATVSRNPYTSPDGRWVVFEHGDRGAHVAIWDRVAGSSEDLVPGSNPRVSDDGRYVVFTRDLTSQQVFLYDRVTHTTTQVTAGNGRSIVGGLSADGRFISIDSTATNLVVGGSTGDENQFIWDRSTATITAVTNGVWAPFGRLSADGRYFSYEVAPSLQQGDHVQLRVLDRTTGTTSTIAGGNGSSSIAEVTADGRFMTFRSSSTDLVTPATAGEQAFLHDRVTGTTVALTRDDHPPLPDFVTADGRTVSLGTSATNLGPSPASSTHLKTVVIDLGSTAAQDQSFVAAAYNDFLGHNPTPAEMTSHVHALLAGTETRSALVNGLASSPDRVSAVVQKLYVDILGRSGDPGGVDYWVGEIRAGRRTVASVAANLYASAEYFDHIAGGTASGWIDRLYGELLGRPADPSGKAYWLGQTTATGRTSVAIRFYQSAESAQARVRGLYQALLQRDPDPGGLAYWSQQVVTKGDIALSVSLASSDEYFRVAQSRFP